MTGETAMTDQPDTRNRAGSPLSRRDFLRTGAAAAGALGLGLAGGSTLPAFAQERKPNFVFIVCDQMNLDAMSYLGNQHVRTPSFDRFAQRGVAFMESHSTNPVCSPARSSLFTSRMPVETSVIENNLAIRKGMPNLGEWLRDQAGYETVYCGKWHLPHGYPPPGMPGFRVLPTGGGQGAADDAWVSRTTSAYLRNRTGNDPFLLVASFMQPHDICYWMIRPETLVPEEMPFGRLADDLPALPPNHESRPAGPPQVGTGYAGFKTDLQWRYYLYAYYRMVEMLDRDLGRLLDTLEDTGLAENTIVVFTADHGEGAGRHGNVQKWHPYDESMKVPMLWKWPERIGSGLLDRTHLVSGLDVTATICDYAGVQAPPRAHGASLRPLLEGRDTDWREYLVSEWKKQGRIVRTSQYKFVTFGDEPAVQLFDMQKDPWEMDNLAEDGAHADTIAEHRKLLDEWNGRMDVAPQPT
jgi:arylsulfatase A-like enzyme